MANVVFGVASMPREKYRGSIFLCFQSLTRPGRLGESDSAHYVFRVDSDARIWCLLSRSIRDESTAIFLIDLAYFASYTTNAVFNTIQVSRSSVKTEASRGLS